MRSEDTPLIRLEDYRPSDWLIDTVDLDISLHPTKTRVRSLLSLRPNPAGRPDAPLVLDGDELSLGALRLDGLLIDESAYSITAQTLTLHAPPARRFTLMIDTEVDPSANTKLMGLYPLQRGSIAPSAKPRASAASPTSSTGQTCSRSIPRGSRRPSLDRARCCSANGNLGRGRRCSLAPIGTTPSGTTRIPSPPTCSRVVGGRARPPSATTTFTDPVGTQTSNIAVHVEEGKTRAAPPMRSTALARCDALGRARVRARV